MTAAKLRAKTEIEVANALLDHAAKLEKDARDYRALAGKVLRPPEGTTVQLGFQNGYPIVRFVTEVEHAA